MDRSADPGSDTSGSTPSETSTSDRRSPTSSLTDVVGFSTAGEGALSSGSTAHEASKLEATTITIRIRFVMSPLLLPLRRTDVTERFPQSRHLTPPDPEPQHTGTPRTIGTPHPLPPSTRRSEAFLRQLLRDPPISRQHKPETNHIPPLTAIELRERTQNLPCRFPAVMSHHIDRSVLMKVTRSTTPKKGNKDRCPRRENPPPITGWEG
jgi:hypothetical protein